MNPKQWRNTFSYDTFTTYSFHRGKQLLEFLESQRNKVKELQTRMETARYMERLKLETELEKVKRRTGLHGIGLYDDLGNIHPTAVTGKTVAAGSPESLELEKILDSEREPELASACIPLYRDAVVFSEYKTGKTIVLHVCLECLIMDSEGQHIKAHHSVYEGFYNFFKACGHDMDDAFVP